MSFYLFHKHAIIDCTALYIGKTTMGLFARCAGGDDIAVYQTNNTEILRRILKEVKERLDAGATKIWIDKYIVKHAMLQKLYDMEKLVKWTAVYYPKRDRWEISDDRGWVDVHVTVKGKVQIFPMLNCPIKYADEIKKLESPLVL